MISTLLGGRDFCRRLKWLFTLVCLATAVAGHAAVNKEADEEITASKAFAGVPLEVLDMLRPSTRLDMLDYWMQADSVLTAVNALGGESRLVNVTPDYLKVEVTPVSTLEIKILPAGKQRIVMTLYTTGSDGIAADTDVRFFDAQFRPLPTDKYLKAPGLKDFFRLKDSGLSEADLKEKIRFMAVGYATGPGEAPLTATFTTLQTLSQEDRDLLSPLLLDTPSAPWKGKFRF